jgi:hypothetical protein
MKETARCGWNCAKAGTNASLRFMSGTTGHTSGLPPSVSLRQTEDTPDHDSTERTTLDRNTGEHCTCGALLAENARFCHLCGRPVFDLPEVAEAPQPVIPQEPAIARPAPLPVGFGNPVALRVAFLMSLGIMLMTMIPVVNVLFPLWWLAAGLCAVLLYRRLTGRARSVGAGARLGSITGVLAFISLVVIISLTLALKSNELFQDLIRQNPDASQVLNNPPALAMAAVMALLILFAMVVGICAAGGALGAIRRAECESLTESFYSRLSLPGR